MVSRAEHCRSLAKHNMHGTPEYMAWVRMKSRCIDPTRKYYHGRSIKVCAEWMKSFEAFYRDIGPRPGREYSIDRYPDNDGDYEPGNVRWATPRQQTNNRRSNRMITYRGVQMTLRNALRMAGDVVRKDTARLRLVSGWIVEDAVETPADNRFNRFHQRMARRTEA